MWGDFNRWLTSAGPLNWELARQTAQWQAAGGEAVANVDPLVRVRLEELARLAEMLVTDETGLAIAGTGVRAVTRVEWALVTLDAWRPLLEALAGAIAPPSAEVEMPEPFAQILGGFAKALNPMLLGVQAGTMVGGLAQRALGQYDLPLPRPAGEALLIVGPNVDRFAADWSLEPDDVRLWVLVSEMTHHAVLGREHVGDRLRSLIDAYVRGFKPNPEAIEERLSELDPADPEALQRALGDSSALLDSMRTPEQEPIKNRLDALSAAVCGYVDHVVDAITERSIGASGRLAEAVRRRRVERPESDRLVERLFGLELSQASERRGTAFIDGVIERAGEDALVRMWSAESDLPTPAEVDAPGLWLARLELEESP